MEPTTTTPTDDLDLDRWLDDGGPADLDDDGDR